MIGGFGTAGQPAELIDALIELGVKDLVIVNNNAGNGDYGLAKLLKTGAVRKIICSFPRQSDSWVFDELYHAGKIELELVPQGNLACRIQAAGMGLGRYLHRLASEHYWQKAKKPVISMAKTMCWNIPSKLTLP